MKRNALFIEYIEKWRESIGLTCKISTVTNYEYIAKSRIIPVFGHLKVKRITNDLVMKFTYSLKDEGLSSKTIKDILIVLKQIFKYANLHIDIIFPRIKRKDVLVLDKDEQLRLVSIIGNDLTEEGLGIYLSLYMGIRIGELCALKWDSIDLNNNIIKIKKTLIRVKNKELDSDVKTKVILNDPKSLSSIRSIPIPRFLVNILKEFKKDDDCYFLTGNEYFIEPRSYSNYYKNMLIKSMIDTKYNFHALRHTFATNCIEAGFDPKTLSEILGHANVNITLDRYVHPNFQSKVRLMNKIKQK